MGIRLKGMYEISTLIFLRLQMPREEKCKTETNSHMSTEVVFFFSSVNLV